MLRLRQPPRAAAALIELLPPRMERDEVLGDMAENFRRRAKWNHRKARRWRQAVAVPVRFAALHLRRARPELQELRHAARSLLATPGFSTVAILTLALGIGANTAIFSMGRLLLDTPLPVDRPEELQLVYHTRPDEMRVSEYNSSQDDDAHSNVSYGMYARARDAAPDSYALTGFNFARRVSIAVADAPAIAAGGLMAS